MHADGATGAAGTMDGVDRRSAIGQIVAEMRRDRILYLIVLFYFAAAACLAVAVGQPGRFAPQLYFLRWSEGLFGFLSVGLAIYVVPLAMMRNPARPATAMLAIVTSLPWPRLFAGSMLFLCIGIFLGVFTSMKNLLPSVVPFYADPMLAAADAWLFGGEQPWQVLQGVLGHHPVTRAIEIIYTTGWLGAKYMLPLAVAILPQLAWIRLRFFLCYFFLWIVLGNVVAALFMSAGPVYYGEFTGDHAMFRDLVAYIGQSAGSWNAAADYQAYLLYFYRTGTVELGTGISAFPSLHVAVTTLFLFAGWAIDRRLGMVLTVLWGVVLVGSVHLGWHYAMDGLVSLVATTAVWWASGKLVPSRRPA